MIKRLLFITLVLPWTSLAQYGRYDGVVQSPSGTIGYQRIAVCTQPANTSTTPCSPLATIYRNTSGTGGTAVNPLQADQLGNFHFYAAVGTYTVQVYGPNVHAPYVLADQNVRTGGTSFIKPTPAMGIQYVAQGGSDGNDGLSWGTAKATIYNALIALPGGSASPPTAGSGTVYVGDGTRANPVANAGVWLMSNSDANYANPPAGWLRANGGGQIIRIEGVGCQHAPANGAGATQCLVNGGSGADNAHPLFWINGSEALRIQNIYTQGQLGKAAMLGIGSDGVRAVGLVNSVWQNVSFNGKNNTGGYGPAVDMGSNIFNNHFDHISVQANQAESVAIATNGLSRSGGTLTVTTASTNPFTTGEKCGITGAADASFNGSFGGSGIRVKSRTTFTVPQNGANATSTGGYVICDRGMAFVVDPGNNPAPGLLYLQNSEFNGGGFRLWTGTSGSSLFIQNLYTESSASPGVWIGGGGQYSPIVISGLALTDEAGGAPAVQNDDPLTSDSIYVNGIYGGYGFGPMNNAPIAGGTRHPFINTGPGAEGQFGMFHQRLYAIDVAQLDAPAFVRFANLAPTANTSWGSTAGLKIVNNVGDRQGGTNAAELDWRSGSPQGRFINAGYTTAVGDWLICGVYIRSLAKPGLGYAGGNPLECNWIGNTITYQYNFTNLPAYAGDGEWEWIWYASKISSQTGSSNTLRFGIFAVNGFNSQVYGPVALHIPAGTLSDSEVMNLLAGLRDYSNNCTVGQICDSLGPVAHGFSCTMSSATTCTATVPSTITKCLAMQQSSGTVIAGECSVRGTTATVTAASSNSNTWAILAF